mmetsp:Transcript_22587/g.46578  ORF Transcript_22587/g.46578 Transcript_22587/m.46578 type:complete len:502 (-) Transcript_22587:104-1609(-)
MPWTRNTLNLSRLVCGRTSRLAISVYTASLTALVLFTWNALTLLSLSPSSSSPSPSSLPEGQQYQTVRTKNDWIHAHNVNHSSSRSNSTGNTTSDEHILLVCSIRTKGAQVSESLVSIPEFYSPESKCKHNFRSSVVFFHVGKAGGGTAIVQLSGTHRTHLQYVHPKPNPKIVQALKSNAKDTPDTLIINVRDPIDRFVSAFRWKLLRTCAPNDTRQKTKRGGAHMVDTLCEVSPEQNQILRETYEGNPSILGEALCDDFKGREKALVDARTITHSTKLIEWLDLLIIKDNSVNLPSLLSSNLSASSIGISDFMALPLEMQLGSEKSLFEQHLKHLAHTLIHKKYGKDAMEKIMTQLEPSQRNVKRKLKLKVNGKERARHSASTYTNETPPVLTPLGECCLARYFEDDYRLIQSMLVTPSPEETTLSWENGYGDKKAEKKIIHPLENVHPILHKACSWGEESQQELCRSDLLSILKRRAHYLDRSVGSCSDLVSKTKYSRR